MDRVAQRACVGSKYGVGGGYNGPVTVGPGGAATFLGVVAFVQRDESRSFGHPAELVGGASDGGTGNHAMCLWHSATQNYEWRLSVTAGALVTPGPSPVKAMDGHLLVSLCTLSGGTIKHYITGVGLAGSVGGGTAGSLDAMAGSDRMYLAMDTTSLPAPTRTGDFGVGFIGLSNGTLTTDAEALDYLAEVTDALQQGRDVPWFRAEVPNDDWAIDARDAVVGGGGLRPTFADRISGVTMTKLSVEPNAYSYPMRTP